MYFSVLGSKHIIYLVGYHKLIQDDEYGAQTTSLLINVEPLVKKNVFVLNSLGEATIVAIHMVKDHIVHCGGLSNILLTDYLLDSCRTARSRYQKDLVPGGAPFISLRSENTMSQRSNP